MESCAVLKKIIRNQKKFRELEQKIAVQPTLKKRCHTALEAAEFAVHHATDVYASPIVEAPFLELGRSVSIELEEQFEESSFLHVMTEGYVSGGHTRCVERWIDGAGTDQKHSCVILSQKAPLPSYLKKICGEHRGHVFLFAPDKSMLERALELRRLASGYSCVVLHIHMDDPVSLIAFGTPEFKRPVVLFNHADHIFWLGVSIADAVADLNHEGHLITTVHRNIAQSSVVGIPPDDTGRTFYQKDEVRAALGIPSDRKIIFASGNKDKFVHSAGRAFPDIISEIMAHEPGVECCIVGASLQSEGWEVCRTFSSRIHCQNSMPYEQYGMWLAASDLVLDSYPVGGGTAVIDAVRAGKPVLCLSPCLQSDFIVESRASCLDFHDLLIKIHRALYEPEFLSDLIEDIRLHFEKNHSKTEWKKRLDGLLGVLPERHVIWDRGQEVNTSQPVSKVTARFCRWIEPEITGTCSIKKMRRWFFRMRWKKEIKILSVCGCRLVYDRNIF